jgi:RNA-directed DNA polymerase
MIGVRIATMSDGLPSKTRLSHKLLRSDNEIKLAFRNLRTVGDVAHLLEIRQSQLTYALWRTPEEKKYRTWHIRKRNGGTRRIDAPRKTHKILQRKLAYVFALVAQRRAAAHGFTRQKSIVTNAEAHARRRWILNIDLRAY